MPSAERPRGPGLAAERTSMTWQRLALGFVSLGALMLGAAAHRNTPWMVLPAAGVFAIGAVITVRWRRRAARGEAAAGTAALRRLTAATVATALVAAALTVIHPG